jgi:hypothetical protein
MSKYDEDYPAFILYKYLCRWEKSSAIGYIFFDERTAILLS